jgi:hypothetical protein
VLSPDNLDGQYIPPSAFEKHMLPGYRRTAERLHAQGRKLVVHVGGPVSRLLPGLARAGVDAIEGVCGPPQGDTSLTAARQLAGAEMTLWGGIPQDVLLPSVTEASLDQAAQRAAAAALLDHHTILGVSDRVPVGADPKRLRHLPELICASGAQNT